MSDSLTTLAEAVKAASQKLDGIIDRVCGACGNSCCHQGTMMGSRDLLRLHKGILLEESREQILREGLKRRATELRADLAALEQVAAQLPAKYKYKEEQEKLGAHLEAWQQFCDFLESDFEIGRKTFSFLQRFSGIRANALRVVQALPAGRETLIEVAGQTEGSFRLTGRRIAPPWCLFHADGCLAGRWKPVKCANFFCTSEPNVLAEIGKAMSFEEFVLGNFRAATEEEALNAVKVELELGREYVAPKIVVGASDELIGQIQESLGSELAFVEVKREDSPFMLSSREAYTLLDNVPENMAYMRAHRSVDGGALYELAVSLDHLRIEGKSLPFYLFADQLSPPTALTHPLWADGVMSQPLGALDLYAVK